MNSNNLKTTWWYRLLQVVYVLVYIFSAILIIIILYSETTKMVIDKERSMVSCHSGRNYTFKELNIRTTPLDYDTDKIVKTQCTPPTAVLALPRATTTTNSAVQ
jgi:nitrate/TMAO reductase-like tetraheme cytochrome c subunit